MYNDFSQIYDALIDVDYSKIAAFYTDIFSHCSQSPHLLLDLGCGTGALTSIMKEHGYDMIGIDSSPEMLMRAKERDNDILYLNQPMTDFELYGTVDGAYSSLDCINYLTDDGALEKTFSLVNNYLNPGALYIFDVRSRYTIEHTMGDNTFVYDDDDIFYTWENCFEDNLLSMHLTFFERQGSLYRRIDEEQIMRAYTQEEILTSAAKAGLTCEGVYDGFSFLPPTSESERLFFILKENGK